MVEPRTLARATGRGWAAERRGFEHRLALIAAGAFALRLVYIVFVRPHDTFLAPDAFLYHQGANLLSEGRGFIDPYEYLRRRVVKPAADHPPAYTLYLTIFSVLGLTTPLAHMIASAVLGTAAVAMVGLVGREVAGPRVGLVAAGIAAVYADLVLVDGSLQSESMAVLVVTGFTYAALRYKHHPTVRAAAGLGALVAWAGLTRPEQFLLGLVVVVPVVLRATTNRRDGIVRVAAAGAMCIAIALPWLALNLVRFHHPVLLSSNFDYTLATTNCPDTWYGSRIGFWSADCNVRALDAAGMTFADGDQSDRGAVWRRAGLRYLGDHPGRLPVVMAARVVRSFNLWNPPGQARLDSEVEGREYGLAVVAIGSFYVVTALAIIGTIHLRRRRHSLVELGGPIVTVLLMAVLFMANARYRAPAEGVVCVLAAVAVVAIREARRRAP